MEAGKKQISDIFNRNRILQIPFFQRSYVWEEEQWRRFLDDLVYISNDRKPYFFGSLIFKQEETESSSDVGDVRTVIDGQQRLTTLIISMKALSLKKKDESVFDTFRLRNHLVALEHNYNDKDSFEKIVKLTEHTEFKDEDEESSNIIGAYNFFMKNIDPEIINENAIHQRSIFVVVDLSKDDDEQQIFDTLNSLGVRLTTAELLKNYFFRRNDIQLYKTHWRAVFEKDSDIKDYWDRTLYAGQVWRTFIDLFFYAYLQIKVQNEGDRVDARDREEFSRLENLFSSYKKFIDHYRVEKENILDEIADYANFFRANFENEVVDNGLERSPSMQRINAVIFGLGTTTLIPYILFIIRNADDENTRRELFHAIESFVMRRLVVRASNRGYNQLFLRMIRDRVLTKEKFYEFIAELSGTVNAMPNDVEMEDGFHNSKLLNKTALGILYFIESCGRSDKHSTSLLGMSKYSLEHLMPKKWENNWGKLNEQLTDARNRKLLTLGNLAMITQKLNASIRDSRWCDKKEKGLIPYASGIEIHDDFLGADEWNEDTIVARAETLLKRAKNIWPTA